MPLLLLLVSMTWHNEVLGDDHAAESNGSKNERASCYKSKKIWKSIEAESDPSYFVAYINQARKGLLCYEYFVEASQKCRDAGYDSCDAARHDVVMDIQKKLLTLGLFPGPFSGEVDKPTLRAISAFGDSIGKSLQSLSVDAVVDLQKIYEQRPDHMADCAVCPSMVNVPAGSILIGPVEKEKARAWHEVTFEDGFAMGKFEVTKAQWRACVEEGACRNSPIKGEDDHPVTGVGWSDIQGYLAWLEEKTGRLYRLPSEVEWEYAARAGTATRYPWGDDIGAGNAHCDGCGSEAGGRWKPLPVGSFSENRFGLHDMHGNVWEWVHDTWHGSYEGAPTDGSARLTGNSDTRVIRGGSFLSKPDQLQSTHRARHDQYPYSRRYVAMGFRVASPTLMTCCETETD
ncbi:MAG: formylglycine-generating enzyme family protein [Alphaproteobacteria bacterium]|nr:formylglycine-generating enzyme family protein [Alphaproteobacteria bacterium]